MNIKGAAGIEDSEANEKHVIGKQKRFVLIPLFPSFKSPHLHSRNLTIISRADILLCATPLFSFLIQVLEDLEAQ